MLFNDLYHVAINRYLQGDIMQLYIVMIVSQWYHVSLDEIYNFVLKVR